MLNEFHRDYVLDWDPVVVKDHEVIENDDGSKTYRFEINDNLKWSDGSPITAKDYVFSLLLHLLVYQILLQLFLSVPLLKEYQIRDA